MEIVLWFFGIIIAFVAVLELIKKFADKKAVQAEVEDRGDNKNEDRAKFGFMELFGLATIIGVVYLLFFTGFSGFDTSSSNTEKYDKYKDTPISLLRKSTDNTIIKDIATEYAINHSGGLNAKKLYDCLSYYVWTKSDEYPVSKMIGWCIEDFNSTKNQEYYNIAELMADFSAYDGAYTPLEIKIKANLNDPSSYEHIETKYGHILHGEARPHMDVETSFRNINGYGAKVINKVRAKVDAKTKEMYDIDVE